MNRKILIILMAFMLMGTSPNLAYTVESRPLAGCLTQEEMSNIVENLQKEITETQQYVNFGIAEFESTTPNYTNGYNNVSLAIDGLEKIEKNLKQISYKGKAPMKASIKKTKAATYLLKGFIECAYYKDQKSAKQSFTNAIKFDLANSIESLLNESAINYEQGNYELAEMYLTAVIESQKLSNKELCNLYQRRAILREEHLNNKEGAESDYKNISELNFA